MTALMFDEALESGYSKTCGCEDGENPTHHVDGRHRSDAVDVDTHVNDGRFLCNEKKCC